MHADLILRVVLVWQIVSLMYEVYARRTSFQLCSTRNSGTLAVSSISNFELNRSYGM